jgi:hypothetical protein
LVEHLVYTERVGGSSPSPPTMALRWRVAVRCALALAGAALLLIASPWRGFAAEAEMTFRLATLAGGRCADRCPQVIVAEGVIEEATPEAFVAFAKTAAAEARLRGIILLNSPGGRVVASMRLGAVFRKLHVAVAVARYETLGARSGPTAGRCMSACVYALMGGAKRIVPPESQVGIHRMSTVEYGVPQPRSPSGPTISYADEEMVNALAHYAAQMGVNPTLIRTAETISPADIRILSPAEMRRWRLATAQF